MWSTGELSSAVAETEAVAFDGPWAEGFVRAVHAVRVVHAVPDTPGELVKFSGGVYPYSPTGLRARVPFHHRATPSCLGRFK